MTHEEELLSKARSLIEEKVGWGSSRDWANWDFIKLSKEIQEATGAAISHVTLKRIWGKVKYSSLPQTNTLNTLAQFLGYESWRAFSVKHGADSIRETEVPRAPTATRRRSPLVRPLLWAIAAIALTLIIAYSVPLKKIKIQPADYSFTSRPTLKAGIPNSVVFDFNAEKAPTDSIVLQQSWDTTLRTTLSKESRQHTLIYYFPGFFNPKLVVRNEVIKELDLLVKSDGWVSAIMRLPVPVYFSKEEVFSNGKMSVPIEAIMEKNIPLSPEPPNVTFCNVPGLGEIYTDDFTFETSVRNDYKSGSSICQMTNIYLLCEGAAVNIPLCAKGCESALNFFFTDYVIPGKERDLSAFGVDFTDYVKVRIESVGGIARIYINERLALVTDRPFMKSRIIGIDYVFQGSGSVDFVRLSNGKVTFNDEF